MLDDSAGGGDVRGVGVGVELELRHGWLKSIYENQHIYRNINIIVVG